MSAFDKKNFKFGQRVRFNQVNENIDQWKGTIIGVSSRYILDTYIVLLDEPMIDKDGTFQSVVMLESCLEVIYDTGVPTIVHILELLKRSRRE